MLSDDQLEQLLRDAHAVEAFHRGDDVPAPKTVRPWSNASAAGPRYRWLALAAAALALIAIPVAIYSTRSSGTIAPRQTTIATPDRQTAPDAVPTSSLVLAVYQNDAGKLSCVNWSAEAFHGRTLASLTSEELTRVGLSLSCDPTAARVLVVGMQGPASALPTTDDHARAVAQCLSTSAPCTSGSFNPTTCASSGCLSQQVQVRIESLALR